MTEVIPLDRVPEWSDAIMQGEVQGRIVVDLQADL
jgi:hypothetical protein